MKWLTKDLALDLLAITIDSLNHVFKAIEASPDPVNGDWPPQGQPYNWGGNGPTERAQESSAPQQQPETQAPDPAPAPAPAPAPEPAPAPQQPAATPQADAEQLHTKAQEVLRSIAMAEGPDWITSTLFPKFGVTSLNDIGSEQLPSLITEATRHQQEKAA